MITNTEYDASVIIPIYNQKESLRTTLMYFSHQTYHSNRFEIIVVDDGSTDGLADEINSGQWPLLPCPFSYIGQENQGRAVARNNGVKQAKGKIVIFCDGDRIPAKDFVEKHIESHGKFDDIAVIGCPYDYFGNTIHLTQYGANSWEYINKLSRAPQYYKKVSKLHDNNGNTESSIAWATFLVGNSSLSMNCFKKTGGFDPDFKAWGFEHFEFGFRMQKLNIRFHNNSNIANYHMPHPRENDFYRKNIEESTALLIDKYPSKNFILLKEFLFGEISLQGFEAGFGNNLSEHIQESEPIYHVVK